jgi:hypothetical protein
MSEAAVRGERFCMMVRRTTINTALAVITSNGNLMMWTRDSQKERARPSTEAMVQGSTVE